MTSPDAVAVQWCNIHLVYEDPQKWDECNEFLKSNGLGWIAARKTEDRTCHADAPNDASGSPSKLDLPERELVLQLLASQERTLHALERNILLLTQVQIAMGQALEALAFDDEDEDIAGGAYLDGTRMA